MNNSNNIEVEAKILDVKHEELEDRIKSIGGEKIFEGELDARWFENVNGKKVRIRKEGDINVTEFKEKKGNNEGYKECTEIGTDFSNFENLIKIYENLGLKQISRSVKKRVSYLIENSDEFGTIRFDFDEYSDLDGMKIPELLEIEATSGEVISKIAELLGFKQDDLKNWDARELAEYYKNL